MNKSQLRLLAAEMADGRIPVGEYRARRRELIDNIVAGTQAIERVEPRVVEGDDDEITTVNRERAQSARDAMQRSRFPLPVPAILAGASALCIVVVIALLWPEDEAPEVVVPVPPSVSVADEVPRSRALVESFVARRDFDTLAINDFKQQWQQFDAAEQERARGEFWFGSLVRALSDEIRTQKALAGLSDGENALNRARAAIDMGEFLGIADKLPNVDDMLSSAAVPSPPAGQSATSQQQEPEELPAPAAGNVADVQPMPAMTTAQPAPAAETATTPIPQPAMPEVQASAATQTIRSTQTASAPTGRQWLAAQADEDLTLQIFAVNKLDRVEQLIGAHPDLDVHVLATEGAVPRYRIYHGVYDNEQSARQAFANLPTDITQASHGAIVKSFSVVREDLRGLAPTPTAATATSPSTDAESFSLQVFATGNRDNAQALVKAFPDLNLQLREISGDAAPWRVVWGTFASADDARNAASSLPQPLLARIGTPLPKPFSALGQAAKP